MIFCLGFRVVCPSPMPFCFTISLVFHLHIETAMEPASNPMLLSKKQIKKEEERLTTELQLITMERNDLKYRLMILTEGAVDNRYSLFQTSWGCWQCHPCLLLLLKVLFSRRLLQTSWPKFLSGDRQTLNVRGNEMWPLTFLLSPNEKQGLWS